MGYYERQPPTLDYATRCSGTWLSTRFNQTRLSGDRLIGVLLYVLS